MRWSIDRRSSALGRGAVILVTGTALTLAACGGGGGTASRTYTIHGTMTMIGEMPADCLWDAGPMADYYADLHEGATVVVKDLAGKELATTKLSAGKPSPPGVTCIWSFAARVPAAKFYAVTVPKRGEVVVSFSQLQKDHWALETGTG
jgi:hypothetical protein